MFCCLLVGLLTPPAAISAQLRSFVGVRVEITETALHRPSRASRTIFGDTLASLFGYFQWLKL
jgi:hypothetical protein